jgi:hypothetical protein
MNRISHSKPELSQLISALAASAQATRAQMKSIISLSLRKDSREGERQTSDQREVRSGRRTFRVVGLREGGRLLQGLVGDGLCLGLSRFEGDDDPTSALWQFRAVPEIHPVDRDLGHCDHSRLRGGGGGRRRRSGGGS